MFRHRIVTGITFPVAVVSASSTSASSYAPSSSVSVSGNNAGPGPEKRRSRRAAATAVRACPRPLPAKPTTIWLTLFPPKRTMALSSSFFFGWSWKHTELLEVSCNFVLGTARSYTASYHGLNRIRNGCNGFRCIRMNDAWQGEIRWASSRWPIKIDSMWACNMNSIQMY